MFIDGCFDREKRSRARTALELAAVVLALSYCCGSMRAGVMCISSFRFSLSRMDVMATTDVACPDYLPVMTTRTVGVVCQVCFCGQGSFGSFEQMTKQKT